MVDDEPKKKKKSKAIWVLHGVLIGTLALVGILVWRAHNFESRQLKVEPHTPKKQDAEALAKRLSTALRFVTISHRDEKKSERQGHPGLNAYLQKAYPAAHEALSREVVAQHSLLYEWKGSDTSRKPLLLVAHTDVAPVPRGTSARWTHPPFKGTIKDGYVWGRGALDDKSAVFAIFEALEQLAKAGKQPKAGIVVALSHDQIRGGVVGTKALAEKLAGRSFDMVLSEGLAVVEGFVPEIPKPIALVGIAERGYASFLLEPADQSAEALDAVDKAQQKLKNAPMEGVLEGAVLQQYEYLASEFPFQVRVALANRWLFSGYMEDTIMQREGSRVLISTTPSGTELPPHMSKNLLKDRKGTKVSTWRLRPGDKLADLERHVKTTVADDKVKLQMLDGAYPGSMVAPIDNESFDTLHRTIREVFPNTVLAPSLVVGSTDARHFAGLSERIYRFRPLQLTLKDIRRTRSDDERIAIDDYARMVQFYLRLLENQVGFSEAK